MADKDTTPPPARLPDPNSSPLTPNPKRVKMPSSEASADHCQKAQTAVVEQLASTDNAAHEEPETSQPIVDGEEDDLEADDGYADSAFGTDKSDSTSISSSIYEGYVENGRRYQTLREGEYWGPSDEKQFESMQACHISLLIMDSKRKNNLYYSPVTEPSPNILDIGTGDGQWCCDVADRQPLAYVQGVDLFPPPNTWVPPNCKFEVDDVLKPWDFKENGRFHLIHMRLLLGAFTDRQWTSVYKQAYENLAPGGWIEQIEPGFTPCWRCDDGTLPADAVLQGWGPMFIRAFAKTGKNIDTAGNMRSNIEAAGFMNVHEKNYKIPVGEWAKSPMLKEAGKFNKLQILAGLEGYAMFLLTHFGEPTPWQPEEVQVYLAKARNEFNTEGYHIYSTARRVWAQKPYDTEKKVEEKAKLETVA